MTRSIDIDGLPGVEVMLLGTVRIRRGAEVCIPPTGLMRALLAALALADGETTARALLDVVWRSGQSSAREATVAVAVHRLRRWMAEAVGDRARVSHLTSGYLLRIEDGSTDVQRFRKIVGQALAADHHESRAALLSAALGVWRGPALDDVPSRYAGDDAVSRLENERLACTVELGRSLMQSGQSVQAAQVLEAAARRYPLDELIQAMFIESLGAAGRQADAFEAYRLLRARLVEELGVEPGPAIHESYLKVLNGKAAMPSRGSRDEPVVKQLSAVAGSPVPVQLPADVVGFAGRRTALRQLDHHTGRHGTSSPGVCVVTGTAGVGKTALAVHWAHKVADQFADGQLYLNLRGFDRAESQLTPQAALSTMLEALGIAPSRMPGDIAGQVGLYRSTLHGRRVLIVLDNARDDDQVRPLLPGSASCSVVVTSRSRLTGLVATESAQPIVLDLLDVAGARQLLAERIGADRIAAEVEAVRDIIERCARLPLALAVVAARAVTNPGFPLRALADELARERAALDAFGGPDPASNLRAVFSWSYQSVTKDAARVFRLLGLHPGPHITTPAVVSLARVPITAVRTALAELCHANLLRESRPGRYTMHDLLRAYATELAEAGDDQDRRQALHRLLDHYLYTAHEAALLLGPHRDPLQLVATQPEAWVENLVDRDGAWAWFTAEYPVLLAVLDLASAAGFDMHGWQLAWACSEFLERLGKWHDHIAAHRAALAAATRAGDRVGQSHANRGLGLGHARLGRHDEAYAHFTAALELSAELGDHNGQARAHNNAGWVLQVQRRYPEAIAHTRQALHLYQASGYLAGQATALNNIGWYYASDGDYVEAIAHCEQALALHIAADYRLGMAETYDSIGFAHHRLGDNGPAVTYYLRALDLFLQSGAQFQEAATATLTNLGEAYLAAGDQESARRVWRQALATLEELGHTDAGKLRDRLEGIG